MQRIDVHATPQQDVIRQAVSVLESGGLVLFPTETTYGAGVDATNPEAVEKLLAYKSRREGKPLSIAVHSIEMAEQYVELNDQARDLYTKYLPGPVTVVSKSKGVVAPGVASEFNTLGVRWPDYPLMLEISKAFGKPITATSANASNKKRPYSIQDVLENLSKKQIGLIDLVLDAGTLPPNPPSTVIDTTLPSPVAVRKGALAIPDSDSVTHITSSEEETKELAGKLCLQHWNAVTTTGVVFLLSGELGVGKTVFAKGVAQFLGITEEITSPTYSYREEYPYTRHKTAGTLFHFDLWKVTPEILPRIGIDEAVGKSTITVIEWADHLSQEVISYLETNSHHPPKIVSIVLEETADSKRSLEITEVALSDYISKKTT